MFLFFYHLLIYLFFLAFVYVYEIALVDSQDEIKAKLVSSYQHLKIMMLIIFALSMIIL